jgi:hypothetical protein
MDVKRKVVLVTVGSTGIAGAAPQAGGLEADVAVNYSDRRIAIAAVRDIEAIGGEAKAVKADLASDRKSGPGRRVVAELATSTYDQQRGPHHYVTAIWKESRGYWTTSSTRTSKGLLRHQACAPVEENGGCVVNVTHRRHPGKGSSLPYAVSKARDQPDQGLGRALAPR